MFQFRGIVTPQVRHPERSEGSQIVQNSGDPSRKKHALRMTSALFGYKDIETYPQPGELRQIAKKYKSIFFGLTGIALILIVSDCFADDTTSGLGAMADSMKGALGSFKGLIGTGSYVVGLGFAIGAIMKFKQHKDNPSNIPIGTPLALLFVAIALVFLPSVVSMTGATSSLTETGESGISITSS